MASGSGTIAIIDTGVDPNHPASIALFNVGGTFYAIDNTCTHEGGPLGEGELAGEVVTCPWHNTEFNVKTGKAFGSLTDEDVRRFQIRVQGTDVMVEVD